MAQKAGQKHVIVIGAGVGGIATAARLAQAGYRVDVYEKNAFSGGRCSLIEHEGFRFDRGPSLLLLPEIFRQTFLDLGTTLEAEGVELLKCEPNYMVHFHDGEHMILSTDTSVMKAQVERFEGTSGFERYLDYLQEAHRHYTLSVTHVLSRTFSSFANFVRPSFLVHALTLHPFVSLYSRASLYFRTERLRRAFTFGSMYMGMSPFEAPGTYSLLQYTELAEGIWYPRGGFHKVPEALVRVAERHGARFHFSSPVKSVCIDSRSKRATGVTLENNETHAADIVVINADLVTAYSGLLPQSEPTIKRYGEKLRRSRTSCSSISFYWGLSKAVGPALTTHNVFLAENYKASFDQIFRDNHLPDDPSFYVNAPGTIDATACPKDTDAIVVLVPCGHLGTDVSPTDEEAKWSQIAEKTREQVLETLRVRTGVDLKPLIKYEQINTPSSWAETLSLDRGAILGLAHDFFSVLAFRPRTRARGVHDCWFVGASTHPGTGVPIVLAGAKLVVEEILHEDRGNTVQGWIQGATWEWEQLTGWAGEGVEEAGRRSLDRLGSLRSEWGEYLSLGMVGMLFALLTVALAMV